MGWASIRNTLYQAAAVPVTLGGSLLLKPSQQQAVGAATLGIGAAVLGGLGLSSAMSGTAAGVAASPGAVAPATPAGGGFLNTLWGGLGTRVQGLLTPAAAAPPIMPGGAPPSGLAQIGMGPGASYGAMMPAAYPGYMTTAGALPAVGGALMRGVPTLMGYLTRSRLMGIIKAVGIQGAAAATGIGLVELAQFWAHQSSKKRRARGISGAAIKTTTRTIGKVNRLHAKLAHAYGRSAPHHRSSSSRGGKVAVGRASVVQS